MPTEIGVGVTMVTDRIMHSSSSNNNKTSHDDMSTKLRHAEVRIPRRLGGALSAVDEVCR